MRLVLAFVLWLVLAGGAAAETQRGFPDAFAEAFGELADRIRQCATYRPNTLIEVAMVGVARGNPHLDETTRILLNSLAAEVVTEDPLFFATPGNAFAAAAPLVSREEIERVFEILPNAPVLMAFQTRRPAPDVLQLRVIAYARQDGAVRCPDERVLFLDPATLAEVEPFGGTRDHMTLEGALGSLFGELLCGNARDVLPYRLEVDLPGECEARDDLPFTVRVALARALRAGDVDGAPRGLRRVPEGEGAVDPEVLALRIRRPRGSEELLQVEGEFLYLPARREPVTRTESYPDLARFRDCAECPEMVVIPGGSFWMGSPDGEAARNADEGPQHRRRIASFALGRTEVTFDDWQACVDDGGCRSNRRPDDQGWGRGSRPVINVSWNDAQEFVDWLNGKVEGEPYRLPSEAEWEYAVRANVEGGRNEPAYHFGATIRSSQANFGRKVGRTVPVDDLSAAENDWCLRHMHGNVWEWVEDCWHDSYRGAPSDGRPWLQDDYGNCARRVVRGGSWNSIPRYLRSAYRGRGEPELRNLSFGFRLARTLLTP